MRRVQVKANLSVTGISWNPADARHFFVCSEDLGVQNGKFGLWGSDLELRLRSVQTWKFRLGGSEGEVLTSSSDFVVHTEEFRLRSSDFVHTEKFRSMKGDEQKKQT